MDFHDNNSSIGISNKLDAEILFGFTCEARASWNKSLGGGSVGGDLGEQEVQVSAGEDALDSRLGSEAEMLTGAEWGASGQ